jgi:hypothetical protein
MSSTFEMAAGDLKEIAKKVPVDVGSGHGVWEYAFYSCDPGTEVLAAMHIANIAGTGGEKFSSGTLVVNNSELSPAVKSAMDKYRANICVTLGPRAGDSANNLMAINILTPNKVYNTYLFDIEHV